LKICPIVAESIQKYIQEYIAKGKKYEGEGIQKFYENNQTLTSFVQAKHELPTLLKEE